MTYVIIFYTGVVVGIITAALLQAAKEGNE